MKKKSFFNGIGPGYPKTNTGWGFNVESFLFDARPDTLKNSKKIKGKAYKTAVKCYDIGGEKQIRKIWSHYLPEVSLIFFLCITYLLK